MDFMWCQHRRPPVGGVGMNRAADEARHAVEESTTRHDER